MNLSAHTGTPRAICGFHQDEHGDWVADLACGHGQHVRHRPPWELRLWVTTEAGRAQHIGHMLHCIRCKETPADDKATPRNQD